MVQGTPARIAVLEGELNMRPEPLKVYVVIESTHDSSKIVGVYHDERDAFRLSNENAFHRHVECWEVQDA